MRRATLPPSRHAVGPPRLPTSKECHLDNAFIHKLRESRLFKDVPGAPRRRARWLYRLAAVFMRFHNRCNRLIRISFQHEHTNRYFGVDRSFRLADGTLQGAMITEVQAVNIFHLLHRALAAGVPGDVVELGCNEGITAALLGDVLQKAAPDRRLHVYDSFEGLPASGTLDSARPAPEGYFSTSAIRLRENFARLGVPLPEIHPGWFKDTLPGQLPARICFAHLDGDLYSSILESLQGIYARLSPGAVVVIDDYTDRSIVEVPDHWPGVKKACDEFLAGKPEKVHVLVGGWKTHGYFVKQG